MNELIELARSILRRRAYTVDGKLGTALAQVCIDLQTSINLYCAPQNINDIWKRIESNGPDVTAAFIDGVSELKMRQGLHRVEWNNVIDVLATALDQGEGNHRKQGPHAIYDMALDQSAIATELKRHPWMVLVCLLVMGDNFLSPEELLAHQQIEDAKDKSSGTAG